MFAIWNFSAHKNQKQLVKKYKYGILKLKI